MQLLYWPVSYYAVEREPNIYESNIVKALLIITVRRLAAQVEVDNLR